MNIIKIINQINKYGRSSFANKNNVFGIAEYTTVIGGVNAGKINARITPSAYVVYTGSTATESVTNTQDIRQIETEKFDVLVVTDATKDRGGLQGITLTEQCKVDLRKALLGWIPDDVHYWKGIQYDGDELEAYDNARIIMRYSFFVERLITAWDGWLEEGDPLARIDNKFNDSFSTSVVFQADMSKPKK